MPTLASRSTEQSGESRLERVERIFRSLPPLGSTDYFVFLKSAKRNAPPAGVLVRAYRRLCPSDAADATLERLADRGDPPGYLVHITIRARRRKHYLGAYTADDLVANTIVEIVTTIAGPLGKIAEGAWSLYLATCMENAFRAMVGRDGARLGSHAATNKSEDTEGDEGVSTDVSAGGSWREWVEPSYLEWLESFIERTICEIADEDIRAVGLDLFGTAPTPVSGPDPKDPNTLTGRFGVSRHTIYRWQAAVRALLYDALDRQDERDIDLSFLDFGT